MYINGIRCYGSIRVDILHQTSLHIPSPPTSSQMSRHTLLQNPLDILSDKPIRPTRRSLMKRELFDFPLYLEHVFGSQRYLTSAESVVRGHTRFGTDQGKANPFWWGWTIRVSAVKIIPETGVGLVGRWDREGGGSARRSQWSIHDPGK